MFERGQEGFEVYKLYRAYLAHFTSKNYDAVKFNKKIGVKAAQYNNNKNAIMFHKLWKRYGDNVEDFLISAFSMGCKFWIGDLFDQKYEDNYRAWKGRKIALKRTLENDINTIAEFIDEYEIDFVDILKPDGDNLPKIIRLYDQDFISLECVAYVNLLTKFTQKIDCNHIFWDDKKLLVHKYSLLLPRHELGWFGSMLKESVRD